MAAAYGSEYRRNKDIYNEKLNYKTHNVEAVIAAAGVSVIVIIIITVVAGALPGGNDG